MPRKKDTMSPREDAKKIGKVIAQAWANPVFKRDLIANPAEVLRKAQLKIPNDVIIEVLEDTPTRRYLVLPLQPTELKAVDISIDADRLCSMGSMCSIGTLCSIGILCSR